MRQTHSMLSSQKTTILSTPQLLLHDSNYQEFKTNNRETNLIVTFHQEKYI